MPRLRSLPVLLITVDYHPKTLMVKAGTRITWTDKDSANHTVTADDKSFDVGTSRLAHAGATPSRRPAPSPTTAPTTPTCTAE